MTQAPQTPDGFWADVKDAVTPRAALLVAGVLTLGMLFIASYTGAFHHPKPKDIPFAVAAPAQVAQPVAAKLDGLQGSPLDPRVVADEAAARREVLNRNVYGALVVDPSATTDHLLVAGGGGASAADALIAIVGAAERAQGRTITVQDLAPVRPGDARGLSAFYLVVGWCVSGYLVAAILAISFGAKPSNPRRAFIRIATLTGYAIVAGLIGATIVGPMLGALPGSVIGLWWLGALIVLATGVATFAFQGAAGVIGVGLTILVIVIAGNPSAGGAYPYPLLPPFWRAIGPWLPPGAGVWTARSIAYFGGRNVAGPLLVLGVWAVVGTALTFLFAVLHARHQAAAVDAAADDDGVAAAQP